MAYSFLQFIPRERQSLDVEGPGPTTEHLVAQAVRAEMLWTERKRQLRCAMGAHVGQCEIGMLGAGSSKGDGPRRQTARRGGGMPMGMTSGVNRLNKSMRDGAGDGIVKRLTLPQASVNSSAGNVIALDATSTAALCTSASEWASFAARYQQFRVRGVRVILEPIWPGAGNVVASTAFNHSALYVGDFIGVAAPASPTQLLSDEGAVVTNTSKRVDFTVDWARNPNAKLWNPTSAALPAPNGFGIAFASNPASATLQASTGYYSKTLEWIVEFRGSQ